MLVYNKYLEEIYNDIYMPKELSFSFGYLNK